MELLRGLNFFRDWAEIFAIILLVIGFFAAVATGSKVVSYVVITLFGLMFGRLWYRYRDSFKFTWFLIMVGFAIGYCLGNFYGTTFWTILFFIFGMIISYYMHSNEMIKSVEY